MGSTPSGWGKGALAAGLCAALCGCAVVTPTLTTAEREKLAAETRQRMFEGQEEIAAPLTLAEATARAIKYQGEHRQRRMEEAAAAAQMDVAKWDLLPKIMLNAGYSWRNNDSFGFGFSPDGTVATNPSASQERVRSTSSIGLAWNLLDFGVSYFKARQLSDQKLITEERRRKAVQTLMHDVRVAWWRAEAAERLLPATDRLLGEIEQAIDKTRHIESRKLLPPVQIATLRRALLDLAQQIAFRREDLAQSRIELAALINSPPGDELHIAAPPGAREVLDLTADIGQLEVLALQSRPELAEEGYRTRISADEARKALVALLPNLSLDLSRNYDSNKFLLNSTWASAGVNVAFNLVKAFSLPALNRSEKAQRSADDARRQAIAMAVLTQTHIAAIRYTLVADEYLVWDEAAHDDDLIVQYLSSSEKVGIDTELELIRARARAMASQINRDLAFANLQASVARLFNSVGYDAVPRDDEAKAIAELAGQVESRYETLERASFSQHVAAKKLALVAGTVSGAEPKVAALLREGLDRVIDSAGMKSGEAAADARLDVDLTVEAAREGRRPVHLTINAISPTGVTLTREFKTTLSLPIDDEQWRVLGEGAAYRVITEISPVRITRPSLRTAQSLQIPAPGKRMEGRNIFPGRTVEPLELRLEPLLGSVVEDLASVGASR
jgi:outer membrane protein TolC